MFLRLVCCVSLVTATLFTSSPGMAQTFYDFHNRDAYVGAYFAVPFAGRFAGPGTGPGTVSGNRHARPSPRAGFRAGVRQRWETGGFRLRRQRTINMDVLDLRFGGRGFERFSVGGQPFIARSDAGKWIFLADPDTDSEAKSGGHGWVIYTLIGVAAAAGVALAVGVGDSDGPDRNGDANCDDGAANCAGN